MITEILFKLFRILTTSITNDEIGLKNIIFNPDKI